MNKGLCWFLGMLSGVVLLAGGEAIVLTVVPSGSILNGFGNTVVNENVGSKGIIPLILDAKTYKVDDFPIVKDLLDQLLAEGGLGDMVNLDYDKIKDIQFSDPALSEKIKNAMNVTATLKSLNVSLGDFSKLSMFKEWTEVTPTQEETNKNPAIYYYKDANGKYARAFNNDGSKAAGYQDGAQLYLANLSEIVVTELFANLSARMPELTYKDFMLSLMGKSESDLQNDEIYKLIGNKKLSELSSIDSKGFKLSQIVAENENNKLMYDILEDLTKTPRIDITLGQLSEVDFTDAKLSSFLSMTDQSELFDVLSDMTGGKEKDKITLRDLKNANIEDIKISSVISDDGGNVIIKNLLNKEAKVGELGTVISGLSLNELFGDKCFTNEADKKVNNDVYYLDGVDYVYCDGALPEGKEAAYISENAGVWLVFAYEAKECSDVNGRAGRFSPSVVTFQELQDNPESFSSAISESRLYQLISAKIINDKPFPNDVKKLSLNQALAMLG